MNEVKAAERRLLSLSSRRSAVHASRPFFSPFHPQILPKSPTADASFGPPACSLQPTAYPWHPHIHALVTEGVFVPDGSFPPLPKLATEPFLKLWEQEVFGLLLAEGKITRRLEAGDWRL
jgi:hypothetical protein